MVVVSGFVDGDGFVAVGKGWAFGREEASMPFTVMFWEAVV